MRALPEGTHLLYVKRQVEVDRVLGTYQADGRNLKVFIDGIRLMTQLVGQPPFEIFAESPSVFFLTVVDATLEFGAGTGPAPTVTLHQGGGNLAFARVLSAANMAAWDHGVGFSVDASVAIHGNDRAGHPSSRWTHARSRSARKTSCSRSSPRCTGTSKDAEQGVGVLRFTRASL